MHLVIYYQCWLPATFSFRFKHLIKLQPCLVEKYYQLNVDDERQHSILEIVMSYLFSLSTGIVNLYVLMCARVDPKAARNVLE